MAPSPSRTFVFPESVSGRYTDFPLWNEKNIGSSTILWVADSRHYLKKKTKVRFGEPPKPTGWQHVLPRKNRTPRPAFIDSGAAGRARRIQ
jgi:hypothetical protein